jgi:hypothetical protein
LSKSIVLAIFLASPRKRLSHNPVNSPGPYW